MNTKRTPFETRFWGKVRRTDSCWEWVGYKYNGYGQVGSGGRRGKLVKAHRAAYQMLVGPIPTGLQLDHLCRNRGCVNPAHLEPVTQKENLRRGMGVVGLHFRATHCKRGHEFTPENTYSWRSTGWRQCRACRQLRRQGIAA